MGFLGTTFRNLGNFINGNASTVMTGVGIGGLVATAVLSGTGTLNADRRLREAKEKRPDEEVSKGEVIKTYAICLIPAIFVGVASIGMLAGANFLDMKDKAALGAMVVAGEQKFKDYKKKVEDKIGIKKEKEITSEVHAEKIKRIDTNTANISFTGNGDTLFYDCQTGGLFYSSIEAVRQAVNKLNKELIDRANRANYGLDVDTDVYVNMNDWRLLLGLEEVESGKFLGHGLQEHGLFEIEEPFTITETNDGRKCILLQYDMFPLNEKDWRKWY